MEDLAARSSRIPSRNLKSVSTPRRSVSPLPSFRQKASKNFFPNPRRNSRLPTFPNRIPYLLCRAHAKSAENSAGEHIPVAQAQQRTVAYARSLEWENLFDIEVAVNLCQEPIPATGLTVEWLPVADGGRYPPRSSRGLFRRLIGLCPAVAVCLWLVEPASRVLPR